MSKIAKKIAEHLGHNLHLEGGGYFTPTATAVRVIDQALEGKIISKSEVESLRRQAEINKSAYDSVFTESEKLRRENEKLKKEVQYITNLAFDAAALASHTPFIFKTEPGKIVDFDLEPTPWWKFWE